MHREMRDISGDLNERADLLVREMIAEQARFRTTLTKLKKEEAIRREQLEASLKAVHRAISIAGVQDALLRGLKSAVTALDAQGEAPKELPQHGQAKSTNDQIKTTTK
jgi:hypothetical protein